MRAFLGEFAPSDGAAASTALSPIDARMATSATKRSDG